MGVCSICMRGWLKADILKGLERWTPTAGPPQGAVISPLLANIYLHPLDELMAALGYRMVRYADDFVVLCQSREEADAALAEIRRWVADERPASASGQDACRRLPAAGGRVRLPRLSVRSRPAAGAQEEPGQRSGTASGQGPADREATASRASSPS